MLRLPTEIDPLRWVPLLAATETLTVPFPVPLAWPGNVIQEELDVAVHEHPAAAVTVSVPLPPADSNVVAETAIAAHGVS